MAANFHENLIKLGTTNPELRPHIRPLLAASPKLELPKTQRAVLPDILRRLGSLAQPHGAKALAMQAKKLHSDMSEIVGHRSFSRDPTSTKVVEIMLGRIINVANAVDAILVGTVGVPQGSYRGTTSPVLETLLWDVRSNFPEAKPLTQGMADLGWYDIKSAKDDIKSDMPGMESFEALEQRTKTDQSKPDQRAYNPDEQWLYDSGNSASKRGVERRLTDFSGNVFKYALEVAKALAVVEKDSKSLLAYFKKMN